MLIVFIKVATIFAMTGVGVIANKKSILPDKSTPYLVGLLIDITLPCLILNSFATTPLNDATFDLAMEILLFGTLSFILVSIVAFFLVKLLHYHPTEDQGVLMAMITAMNAGFMGFPISKAVFGDDMFFMFIILNIPFNIYMYTLGVLQINYGSKEHLSIQRMLRSLINPPIISTAIGCLIMFIRIQMPGTILEFLQTIGDSTIPLSMILVGVQLSSSNIGGIIKNYKLVLTCLFSIVIAPITVFFFVNWLPIQELSKAALIFANAFPTAVIVSAISLQERKNAQLASEGVALSTLMSMATLPIVSILLMEMYF